MDKEIKKYIQARLSDIEKEHDVKILYAVESGSRAWGFASTDSDYDVRFIYAHKRNWYLNILPKRDVIEYPIVDDFDYSGWDLRKTLFLVNKSNPVFFEWLGSPIVYYRDDMFYAVMEKLARDYFNPIASIYHYLHMASGNNREFLQTEQVKIKKYFYVLRPLLACLWIEKYRENPPIEFERLLVLIDDKTLLAAIDKLLVKKKSGMEMGMEAKIVVINDFIDTTLDRFSRAINSFNARKKPDPSLLENGFIQILDYLESGKRPPI